MVTTNYKCKTCRSRGHVGDLAEGKRVLCGDCTVSCPDCDGRGWTYDKSEDEASKEGCGLCSGNGWLAHKWVAKFEDGLGPFTFLRDVEDGPVRDGMNRSLRNLLNAFDGKRGTVSDV